MKPKALEARTERTQPPTSMLLPAYFAVFLNSSRTVISSIVFPLLQQHYAGFFAGGDGSGVPYTGLYLADMGASNQEHTQP